MPRLSLAGLPKAFNFKKKTGKSAKHCLDLAFTKPTAVVPPTERTFLLMSTLAEWLHAVLRSTGATEDWVEACVNRLRDEGCARPQELGATSDATLERCGFAPGDRAKIHAARAAALANDGPLEALLPYALTSPDDDFPLAALCRGCSASGALFSSVRLAKISALASPTQIQQLTLTWHVLEARDGALRVRRVERRFPDEDFCGFVLSRSLTLKPGEHVRAVRCGFEVCGSSRTWTSARPRPDYRLASFAVETSARSRRGIGRRTRTFRATGDGGREAARLGRKPLARVHAVLECPKDQMKWGLLGLGLRAGGEGASIAGVGAVWARERAFGGHEPREVGGLPAVDEAAATPAELRARLAREADEARAEAARRETREPEPRANPFTGQRVSAILNDPWLREDAVDPSQRASVVNAAALVHAAAAAAAEAAPPGPPPAESADARPISVAAPLPLTDEHDALPLAVVAAPFDDALAHGAAYSLAMPLATVLPEAPDGHLWPAVPDHDVDLRAEIADNDERDAALMPAE